MQTPSDNRRFLSVALPPLLLAVVAAIGVGWASGWNLGALIGGVVMTTLLVPAAVLANEHPRDRLLTLLLTVMPLLTLWLIAARRTETSWAEWAGSSAVLVSYAMALAGLAVGMRAARLSATVSAALTVVLGLAWLTWPIWLSRTWNGEASAPAVNRWIAVHPVLSVSLPHLGHWAERTIAYHLTDLNQSVSYAPPRSVWTCVLVHGALGASLFGLTAYRRGRRVAAAMHAGV
jgi:hypothetical protein